jgi:hypothetical protein
MLAGNLMGKADEWIAWLFSGFETSFEVIQVSSRKKQQLEHYFRAYLAVEFGGVLYSTHTVPV